MPGGKKRAEAFEDLKKAKSLAKDAGDKKVELQVSDGDFAQFLLWKTFQTSDLGGFDASAPLPSR